MELQTLIFIKLLKMSNSISKKDFTFELIGHGHYKVTYKSPQTGKIWSTIINDMTIIDLTKNEEDPRKVYLNQLKGVCKCK